MTGLNPYCNGRYSWRVMTQIVLYMVVERLFVSISLQISKISSAFLRAAKVQKKVNKSKSVDGCAYGG